MRPASRRPSPDTAALTSVGNPADAEHALDALPVGGTIRRHGTAGERTLQVGELHHRRERLATIVRREQTISVDGEVGARVDSLRFAKALTEAAQMRRRSWWQELGGARRPHVQRAAGSSGVQRAVRCAHEGSELAVYVQKRPQVLATVGRDDDSVGDSGELPNINSSLVDRI